MIWSLGHDHLPLRNPRPSHDRLAATYSMVHVMSEVKCSTCKGAGRIEFEQGQRYAQCLTCSGSGIDWRKSYDAQRLRADTAEAELIEKREEFNKLGDRYDAAEQRIAEMLQICCDIQDDPRLWLMVGAELSGRISAALNPNPKEERHE